MKALTLVASAVFAAKREQRLADEDLARFDFDPPSGFWRRREQKFEDSLENLLAQFGHTPATYNTALDARIPPKYSWDLDLYVFGSGEPTPDHVGDDSGLLH